MKRTMKSDQSANTGTSAFLQQQFDVTEMMADAILYRGVSEHLQTELDTYKSRSSSLQTKLVASQARVEELQAQLARSEAELKGLRDGIDLIARYSLTLAQSPSFMLDIKSQASSCERQK